LSFLLLQHHFYLFGKSFEILPAMFYVEINMLTSKDFKTALSSLLKAKGYVFTIVLTLGITLGALVAMFNLNYQILAAPLPYPEADQLYVFQGQRFEKGELSFAKRTPYPLLIESYQKADEYFSQKALIAYGIDVERNLLSAPSMNIGTVTPEFLPMLQAPLALGRYFSADEGLNSMAPVAILSFNIWTQMYQQDASIIGKTANFKGVEFKIIGVLAKNFVEPAIFQQGWQTDIWLPFDYNDIGSRNLWQHASNQGHLVGRLKLGASILAAEHQFNNYAASRFKEETAAIAGFTHSTTQLKLFPFKYIIVGDTSNQSLLMLAGALVLLLIAAANVTNLILSRAVNQQRTMAIQVALGAQQKHVFKAVLAEIVVLMTGAGFLSLVLASVMVELLKNTAKGQLPRLDELYLNGTTFLFAGLVALILALLLAVIVSRQINYRVLNSMLQSSGKGTGIQISQRVRSLLILSQIMLTGVLLAVSLQILQESLRQLHQPLGINTEDTYQVSLNLGTLLEDASAVERHNYLLSILSELRSNPKVLDAGIGSLGPVSYWTGILPQRFLQTELGVDAKILATAAWSDGSYLHIFNIPLLAGRYYTDSEANESARVIVVNQTLARLLRADGQVLGQRLFFRGNLDQEPSEIIGVVKDLQLPGQIEPPRFFQPYIPTEFPLLLIHVKPAQQFTRAELNELMAKVNPEFKVFRFLTTKQAHQQLITNQKTIAGLTAALALLAMGLTTIGIYGILSYSVQLRRFELGIRMAIGARPNTVFMQILKDNLAPVIIGLLVALAILISLWLWIQQTNYNLQTSSIGWLLPPLLILVLTAATSLLSVWQIIRKQTSEVLRGG
jgi:putative ABC transport system permease protein